MKKILTLFLIISTLSFASSEEALKNALDRLYVKENISNVDIRTAKALYQPEEKIVTIQYNNQEKSGYTSSIQPGEEYSCYITLFKGYEYIIVGSGDNASIDVDIFVYDLSGNTIALDRTPDSTAYAMLPKDFVLNKDSKVDKSIAGTDTSVRPLETQKYLVKLKLRDSSSPNSDVAFLVATRLLNK